MPHKVDVEGTAWIESAPGARFQRWTANGLRLRILELGPAFVEPEWCSTGHIIHVLSGDLEVDFDGDVERFATGDVLVISSGDRHKARALGSVARLLVVDDVD